jgi:excisionase family DNA binding protein
MRKRRDVELVDLDDRLTVTIQRTADVLDIGRSTVYELLRAGKLKGVKFGRAHRIVVQSIRDLVAESWVFEFSVKAGPFVLENAGQRTTSMSQRISQWPGSTASGSTQERSSPSFVLLTPKETAARLRVSLSFLAKARMRDEGPPFISIGRAIRYSESDLIQWIRSQERLSASE